MISSAANQSLDLAKLVRPNAQVRSQFMKIRNFFVAMVAAVSIGLVAAPISAQSSGGPTNLFPQYYTPAVRSMTNAGMYPAPHWVPREVGHTYYTYQPLMPHEMMYVHSRNYYNFYAGPESFYCDGCKGSGGGSAVNKTTVRWQNTNSYIGRLPFSSVPLQKLHYHIASKHFFVDGKAPSSGCKGCANGKCRLHQGITGYTGGCSGETCGQSCNDGWSQWGDGGSSDDGYYSDDGYSYNNPRSWSERAAAATSRLNR